MATVRTETIEYRGYEIRAVEWMGTWQASVIPLSASLWQPSAEQLVDAARPSLEAALAAYRQLVDRLNPPAKTWAEILKDS